MQLQYTSFVLALVASLAGATPTPDGNGTLVQRDAHSGIATVYTQQGGTGACGIVNPDSARIAAVANGKAYCGRQIQMTNTGGHNGVGGKGKVITTTVQDVCPSCDANHVDLSVGSWDDLTDSSPWGVTNIECAMIETAGVTSSITTCMCLLTKSEELTSKQGCDGRSRNSHKIVLYKLYNLDLGSLNIIEQWAVGWV
ncbi:uncharacterized protein BP5553_09165 [Venustampulla echinocandica]|uniref:RlpA-like protein double-psi beta-barrel domain-containing protein n=1 Tax=Venustampulla echinocandica TaxID=2656787 RepID=A0A370TBY8_9HELO|nr:uncharacterized protein BP5553_09165 [Venustampulla echinocandica]RDL31763.1 hypothetical protein BP5553_09165 [Venustampulla echinocandica]